MTAAGSAATARTLHVHRARPVSVSAKILSARPRTESRENKMMSFYCKLQLQPKGRLPRYACGNLGGKQGRVSQETENFRTFPKNTRKAGFIWIYSEERFDDCSSVLILQILASLRFCKMFLFFCKLEHSNSEQVTFCGSLNEFREKFPKLAARSVLVGMVAKAMGARQC